MMYKLNRYLYKKNKMVYIRSPGEFRVDIGRSAQKLDYLPSLKSTGNSRDSSYTATLLLHLEHDELESMRAAVIDNSKHIWAQPELYFESGFRQSNQEDISFLFPVKIRSIIRAGRNDDALARAVFVALIAWIDSIEQLKKFSIKIGELVAECGLGDYYVGFYNHIFGGRFLKKGDSYRSVIKHGGMEARYMNDRRDRGTLRQTVEHMVNAGFSRDGYVVLQMTFPRKKCGFSDICINVTGGGKAKLSEAICTHSSTQPKQYCGCPHILRNMKVAALRELREEVCLVPDGLVSIRAGMVWGRIQTYYSKYGYFKFE